MSCTPVNGAALPILMFSHIPIWEVALTLSNSNFSCVCPSQRALSADTGPCRVNLATARALPPDFHEGLGKRKLSS
jgi:hypothetical protein